MRTCILGEVPYPNAASTVAANDLALVRVYDHVVGRGAMAIASLDSAGSGFPYLHRSVFRTCDHPLPFAVESDPRNVSRVAFKNENRRRIGGPYVE